MRGWRHRTVLSLARLLLFAVFAMAPGSGKADADILTLPPERPVEVQVGLSVNKIYNVDTIAETYAIDAYLNLRWVDPRLAGRYGQDGGPATFFNDRAEQMLEEEIWSPSHELINLNGNYDKLGRSLSIDPIGEVLYSERFRATFGSSMDFHQFPFDTQQFEVVIESFEYSEKELQFAVKTAGYQGGENPEWLFEPPETEVVPYWYDAFGKNYSRYRFVIEGDRKHGYFIWQFFFPLIMIVGAACMVFWISDFGDQLSTAFTLFLTVVAFNFYVSTWLPRLPYNTFIEISVISAYLTIFLTILSIVTSHQLMVRGREGAAACLTRTCRWLFPAGVAAGAVTLGAMVQG